MTAIHGYNATSPNLTIIIVGWNAREYLAGCLRSLYKHSPSCMFEVIYVDNGSEDGSANFVRKHYPLVIIVENDENLGFQKANNQGIRIAQGKYIVLLNSDTIILPGTFDKMLAFMDANPRVGAASPKCLYPDGRIQWSISQFPTVSMLWWWLCERHRALNWLLRIRKPKSLNVHQTQEHDYAYGAFFALRRDALRDAGLMDETFFLAGDDAAWSFRIKAKGWKIFYVADVEVIHYAGKSRSKQPSISITDWLNAHRILLYRYKGWVTGLGGDAIFLSDLVLHLMKSLLSHHSKDRKDSILETPKDCWKVLRTVYLSKAPAVPQ